MGPRGRDPDPAGDPVGRQAADRRLPAAAAPADLKDRGNIDFITLDRSDRDHWKIGIEKIAKAAARAVAAAATSVASTQHPHPHPHPHQSDGGVVMFDLKHDGTVLDVGGGVGVGGDGEYEDDLDLDEELDSAALLGHSRF